MPTAPRGRVLPVPCQRPPSCLSADPCPGSGSLKRSVPTAASPAPTAEGPAERPQGLRCWSWTWVGGRWFRARRRGGRPHGAERGPRSEGAPGPCRDAEGCWPEVIPSAVYTRAHTPMLAHTHTLTRSACTHTRARSHTHAHTRTHAHALTHSCTHACTHARTHAHNHAHTHSACTLTHAPRHVLGHPGAGGTTGE